MLCNRLMYLATNIGRVSHLWLGTLGFLKNQVYKELA